MTINELKPGAIIFVKGGIMLKIIEVRPRMEGMTDVAATYEGDVIAQRWIKTRGDFAKYAGAHCLYAGQWEPA
jgi:hypothetical protein